MLRDLKLNFQTSSEIEKLNLGAELAAMAYDLLKTGRCERVSTSEGHRYILNMNLDASEGTGKTTLVTGGMLAFEGVATKKPECFVYMDKKRLIKSYLQADQLKHPVEITSIDILHAQSHGIPNKPNMQRTMSGIQYREHAVRSQKISDRKNSIGIEMSTIFGELCEVEVEIAKANTRERKIIATHFPDQFKDGPPV